MDTTPKKLALSAGLIIALGIIITAFSTYHAKHMQAHSVAYPLFLYGTALVSLAIGGLVVYLLGDRITRKQLEGLTAVLPPDERKVMRLLIERKEIEQKRLVALSGLSAVKTSRVLSTLEGRGVVERKRLGTTNLVTCKL